MTTAAPAAHSGTPSTRYLQSLVLRRHDQLALLCVILFALLAFSLSATVGLELDPPVHVMLTFPALVAGIGIVFHLLRPRENQLFQIFHYATLWMVMPLAGVHLSYLAVLAGMPLQSDTFTELDRSLGFDWNVWADFVTSRPWLEWLCTHAYLSYSFQPYVAIVAIAYFGSATRNARFILATMIALSLTILISAALPSVQPGLAHGYPMPADKVFAALRSGELTGLGYVGLINFPSFHSAMACLFVVVYRGMPRLLIWLAAALNSVMLVSVPFTGDHYLIDVFGGIGVALAGIYLSGRLVPER